MAKKVKKVKPTIPKTCINCYYYRGDDAGSCHRYPIATRAKRLNWCGEFR